MINERPCPNLATKYAAASILLRRTIPAVCRFVMRGNCGERDHDIAIAIGSGTARMLSGGGGRRLTLRKSVCVLIWRNAAF
jgi:hypothetical protein